MWQILSFARITKGSVAAAVSCLQQVIERLSGSVSRLDSLTDGEAKVAGGKAIGTLLKLDVEAADEASSLPLA